MIPSHLTHVTYVIPKGPCHPCHHCHHCHCRVTSCGVVTITAPSILASLRYVTMDKCLNAAFRAGKGERDRQLQTPGRAKGSPLLNQLSINIKGIYRQICITSIAFTLFMFILHCWWKAISTVDYLLYTVRVLNFLKVESSGVVAGQPTPPNIPPSEIRV